MWVRAGENYRTNPFRRRKRRRPWQIWSFEMAGVSKELFWSHIDSSSLFGCWPWKGWSNGQGYGKIATSERGPRAGGTLAHRIAWEFEHGQIPDGLCVCHHCDNPRCCRPSHLFIGTKADNNRDMRLKGRAKGRMSGRTHCKNGHPLSGDNLRWVGPHRRCWICFLEWQRGYRKRLKQ